MPGETELNQANFDALQANYNKSLEENKSLKTDLEAMKVTQDEINQKLFEMGNIDPEEGEGADADKKTGTKGSIIDESKLDLDKITARQAVEIMENRMNKYGERLVNEVKKLFGQTQAAVNTQGLTLQVKELMADKEHFPGYTELISDMKTLADKYPTLGATEIYILAKHNNDKITQVKVQQEEERKTKEIRAQAEGGSSGLHPESTVKEPVSGEKATLAAWDLTMKNYHPGSEK